MPSTFTLNGFQAEIEKNGFAPANKYDVTIKGPRSGPGIAPPEMLLRCSDVSMAGRTLNTALINEYGLIKKMVYRNTFTDFSMSFICSKDMSEKKYFNNWMNKMSPTPGQDPGKPDLGMGGAFDVGYYDDYIAYVSVFLLDDTLNTGYHIHYHEAYPLSMTEIQLGYATNNSFLKLTVNWAYAFWTDKLGDRHTSSTT